MCPTKLIHPLAKVPTHGSDRAAGYDIYCVGGLDGLEQDFVSKMHDNDPRQLREWQLMAGGHGEAIISPNTGFLFRTGMQMAIQEGHACYLWDRSGMGGSRLVHRFAGVIDEDYRGEWFVRLFNFSKYPVAIVVGDRIVQGIYQERIEVEHPIVDTLPESVRGTGGLGSTGD